MSQLNAFAFTPEDGLRNSLYSPTSPSSEAAIREQIQGISDQLAAEINALYEVLHSISAGTSGAEEIGSPTVEGLTGNNVFLQIQALKDIIDTIQIGAIPEGSILDSMLSNADGAVKDRLDTVITSTIPTMNTSLANYKLNLSRIQSMGGIF